MSLNPFWPREDKCPEGSPRYKRLMRLPGRLGHIAVGIASGFPICCVLYFSLSPGEVYKERVNQPNWVTWICCPWHARFYSRPDVEARLIEHIETLPATDDDEWQVVPNYLGR